MQNLNISDYKHLVDLEKAWIGQLPRNKDNWDWQPYPLEDFINMCQVVADAYPPGMVPTFLDPGCGIGTKVYVAQQVFGWEAAGFDICEKYIQVAVQELGLDHNVLLFDADEFPHYDVFDIVYLSRPFRDDKREYRYEQRVQNEMKPGAFLIMGWAGAKPQWEMYYRGPWKGVWRKPLDGKPVEPLPLAPIPHGTTLASGYKVDMVSSRPDDEAHAHAIDSELAETGRPTLEFIQGGMRHKW
jgi:SAM-dependent methyltransferase